MPAISGVTRDSSNALASRLVRAYRRDTGAFVGQALSDPTTGAYSITTATTAEHFVLAHDTADADLYWNSVSIACRFNGTDGSTTFTEEKGVALTRFDNAQISTTESKFGGSSAYFDGSGDYLSAPAGCAPQGTEYFTMDMWFRVPSLPAGGTVKTLTQWLATTGTNFELTSAGAIGFFVHGTGQYMSGGSVAANTWYHLALVRDAAGFKCFLGGVKIFEFASTVSFNSAVLYIGWDTTAAARAWYGYLDDFRITRGVARYSAYFTPPTATFPAAPVGGTENAVILDRVVPV